ncbi:hypothetical protein [Nocardia abscessus]|uniref:hypothetical protein n=1 Tax=Nocardia abscessus TaxID=120957 RepID=UPI0005BE0AEF|nr:hypothetical protein [Nocardia abscessus]MCC3331629.1 hypothetical protein [Nocardia abscessus]
MQHHLQHIRIRFAPPLCASAPVPAPLGGILMLDRGRGATVTIRVLQLGTEHTFALAALLGAHPHVQGPLGGDLPFAARRW